MASKNEIVVLRIQLSVSATLAVNGGTGRSAKIENSSHPLSYHRSQKVNYNNIASSELHSNDIVIFWET